MKTIRFSCFLIIITLVNIIDLYSAITVTYSNPSSTDAPRMSVEVTANQDGTFLTLTETNVLLLEDTRTTYPDKVTSIGNNIYLVEWMTALEEYPQYDFPDFPDDIDLRVFQVIVSNNNQSGIATVVYENPGLPTLAIKERVSGSVVKELEFFKLNRQQISVVGSPNHPNITEDTFLDSITFTSPYFTYNWQGVEVDMISRPPMRLKKGFHYLVDIFYNPPSAEAYRGQMLFHYNNGMVKTLALIGGKFSVDQISLLQLIQPNGGEKLTPCQEYDIKWKGHSKDDPVIIEFSTDGGSIWQLVNKVRDSVYKWNVPNLPSDNVLVRVRQEFTKVQETLLKNDWSTLSKIAFNSNGSLALAANTNGKIAEFDIYNSTSPIGHYYVKPKDYSRGDVINIGTEYIKDNNEIVYFYKESLFSPSKMSFFKKGEEDAYKTITIDGEPSKIHIDPKRRYIAVQLRLSPQIQLLSPNDGSLLGSISLKMPVNTLSINRSGDSIAVIEIDGRVSIFKMNGVNDFKLEKSFKMEYLPIITNTKFSPNGKLLAISIVQTDNTATESYLYDLERNQIVRTYRPAVGGARSIDFSPSSSSLIIGSANLDHIVMYDLTGTDTKSILAGHAMQLQDLKLDPEGFAILSSSTGEDNLKHRSFSYPELDKSNSSFRIIKAKLDYSELVIPNLIIGTDNTFIYQNQFCNNGEIPVYIYNTKMENGTHIELVSSAVADTVQPGQCKEIAFVITPVDTGNIVDNLIMYTCQMQFNVPIKFRSLDRKLTLINPSGINMGESCVMERVFKDFTVFRNDDTMSVLINSISIKDSYTSPFRVEQIIKDTIINPGETLTVRFSFEPKALGLVEGTYYINHSNQLNVFKIGKILGTGIGTFLDVSHQRLMFNEEISQRAIIIKNTGEKDLYISNIDLNPAGYYEIITPLPLNIVSGATDSLIIKRIQKASDVVKLIVSAKPCLVSGDITLENYNGGSLLEITDVFADPRGRAEIAMKFNNSENSPYKGERYFIGEFTVNPRMFLPDAIHSDFGTSTILRNEIINDKRHIEFRIDGDFGANSGTLCKISGFAGLAETKSSPLEWVNSSFYWGKSINTVVRNGVFNLIGICNDRLVLQNNTGAIIQSINPNPANEIVTIIVDAKIEETASIEILDFMGQVVFTTPPIKLIVGENEIQLNLQYLSNGQYSVLLRSDANFYLKKLIILR